MCCNFLSVSFCQVCIQIIYSKPWFVFLVWLVVIAQFGRGGGVEGDMVWSESDHANTWHDSA